MLIQSSDSSVGDDDTISVGDGFNVVIGGQADDTITSGIGDDIIAGDAGSILFDGGIPLQFNTLDDAIGGADVINASNGANFVFGGQADDRIDTGSGIDFVFGDSGQGTFDALGTVREWKSVSTEGGDDFIVTGGARDVVIAGHGSDVAGTGSDDGSDIVLADHGQLDFGATGLLTKAFTTDPMEGGDDQVYAQDGIDIVFGGPGNDRLVAGADDARDTARDVVLGDSGSVDFDSLESPTFLTSTDHALGGNDVIITGGGDDITIGGMADDIVLAGAGDDVAFGDNADLTFSGGIWMRLESTAQETGGYDQILMSFDDDIVVAGTGPDVIWGGEDGDDIILGDNGLVVGNDGSPEANDIISTGYTLGGGIDKILDEDGMNHIIGGHDSDNITGGGQRDWIAGDYVDIVRNGSFQMQSFTSVGLSTGANDGISGRGGFDIIVAGYGSDIASGHSGKDVIVGDHAEILTDGELIYRVTTMGDIGNADTLYGDTDNDFIFGGVGGDTIDGGFTGQDLIVGDNAVAHFTSLTIEELVSIDPTVGGADIINGQSDNDFIIGGLDDDVIDGGTDSGADVVIGDHGHAIFDNLGNNTSRLRRLETIEYFHAGFDDIVTGDGPDIAFGGSHGDTIHTGSDSSRDIIAGDNAVAIFDADGVLVELTTTSPTIGSGDILTSEGGADIVIAGRAFDTVNTVEATTGSDEGDFVLGDGGSFLFDNVGGTSVLRQAISSDHDQAHDDTITVGNGDNVVIASSGDDSVTSGDGRDLIMGDSGTINFDAAGVMTDMTSTDTAIGGDDTLTTGAAGDVVIGGFADDVILSESGDDIVFGDSAFASFNQTAYLRLESIDQTIGGNDRIEAGENDDIAIGGTANDIILGGTNGADTILGDNGLLLGDDGSAQANDIITTGYTDGGGVDGILDDDGANIIIGGDLNDNITGGGQRDWIAGDYVDVIRGAGFVINQFISTSNAQGGNDGISGKGGWDIIFAGAGDDTASGHSGKDIVLGDNGHIITNGDAIQSVTSTTTSIGGDDTLFGDSEDDLIIGGDGLDTISAGTNNDTVFGDNASANTNPNLTLKDAQVIASTDGADDNITGDDGHDLIFGGTASDTISGNAGHDVIFGDHGFYDSTLPVDQNFESMFITDSDSGAVDTIHGNEGDDFLIGGQAGDFLFGDDGQDDITGGHNVRFGVDGSDTIEGGNHADVILGDNGVIERSIIPNTFDQWEEYPAPFADVIRTVTRYDDVDRIEGDETILAGDGDDRVFGQRGNDNIDGGAGDDELIGHLGDDTIQGGADHDTILSDVGTIHRDFLDDGSPNVKQNGSWHRDVVLEDVGNISGIIDMDQTPLRVTDPDLAQKLITTDLLVLSAAQTVAGERAMNSDNGAWDTDALLIDLLPANNDIVDGGSGEDYIFGQRGADDLSGGADDDYIFGDNFTNTIAHRTELPKATHTYRLLETTDSSIVLDEFGSVIVTPVTQQPEEMDLNNPYNRPELYGNVWHEVAGLNAQHAGVLTRADGTTTVPVIGVTPDVVHHTDSLPGNDTIAGDGGDDFIVADNANAYSPLITGFSSIEDAGEVREKANLALARVMHSLGILSIDYLRANGGTTGIPQVVSVAEDTVDGGTGNDHIMGDDAMIVADVVTGLPVASEDLADAASDLQEYLNDVERLAVEFEYVTFEAHFQVLTSMLGTGGASVIDPDFHDLQIGNDTLIGNDGDDVVTGDHAAILTSTVDGQQFNTIDEQFDSATWNAASHALTSEAAARETELDTHTLTHHNTANRTLSTAQLASLPVDFELDQSIGNDDIDTGNGDDLAVGDFGAYAFPILDTLPITTAEQQQASADIDKLTSGLARWLEEQHHETTHDVRITVGYDHPLYDQRDTTTQWTMLAGNDTIDVGADNDFALGDSISISTNLIIDDLSARFSEDESQFKVDNLNRSQFELTDHFTRFGGSSIFGNDTMTGGDGNDILFGQTQTNTLFGNDGDDELFGGEGPNNIADGGAGGGTSRAGSTLSPSDIWLDALEDYQFDRVAGLNEDLATELQSSNEPGLQFSFILGNFLPPQI